MDKTAKDRMSRYRNKKRNETVTKKADSVTDSVTELVKSVTADVTAEHLVMKYLVEPKKRAKMEAIVSSLKSRGLQHTA